MTESRVRWLRALLVIVGVIMLQVSVLDCFQLFGVARIDLPLILVVAIGFVATPNDAALLGFTTGLLLDTMQFGPFGLSALVYCVAAWLIVMARQRVLQAGASFRTVQGATIVVLVTAATWAAGTIFGLRPPSFGLTAVGGLLLAGAAGAVIVHPLTGAAGWMVHDHERSSMASAAMAKSR